MPAIPVKASPTSGNSSMVRFLLPLAMVALVAGSAGAAPCATVSGDPVLASAVVELLVARGITASDDCGAIVARVTRDRDAIVVARGEDELAVSDAATAATVVESWARADVASPLLAERALPQPPVARGRSIDSAVAITASAGEPHGLQVFAALETSIASDRTSWLGSQVGACVMIGPICAAARMRFAKVTGGPGPWEHQLDRAGGELLVGGDIPFRIGPLTLVPGFGGGLGEIGTHVADVKGDRMYNRTGGLRADAHAVLSYPIGHRFALDLTVAADITQATHVETDTTMQFPDEPWLLVRMGVGVRYGGP
jgi:hypothetical protein